MLGEMYTGVPVEPFPVASIGTLMGRLGVDNAEQVRLDRDQRMWIGGYMACARMVAAGTIAFEEHTREDGSVEVRFVSHGEQASGGSGSS